MPAVSTKRYGRRLISPTSYRDDGVGGVFALHGLCRLAHHDAVGQVAHHRGQHGAPVFVVEHHADAVAHRGHQRVGGAEVDAHRQPVLVGQGA